MRKLLKAALSGNSKEKREDAATVQSLPPQRYGQPPLLGAQALPQHSQTYLQYSQPPQQWLAAGPTPTPGPSHPPQLLTSWNGPPAPTGAPNAPEAPHPSGSPAFRNALDYHGASSSPVSAMVPVPAQGLASGSSPPRQRGQSLPGARLQALYQRSLLSQWPESHKFRRDCWVPWPPSPPRLAFKLAA